jgi:subtilisin-like proprotein convertase family protein
VEEWVEVFSNQVPRPIPDLGEAVSQLNFAAAGTILEAFLEFRIRHTCRNDLLLELRHPDGSTYSAEGPPDCQGLWEGPLGVPAEDRPSNGTWTLTAFDTEPGDQGQLETWGLRLRIRR